MPACEYVVYLQQLPATINGRLAKYEEILAIEEELANPVGAPISSPPFMVMSAIIISPDCGFAIRSKASPEFAPQESLYLMGPKREQYKHHVERFLMLLSAVYVIQAYFLQRQMKECSTPSTQSRASFYTIAMMSIGDGLSLCFALLVVSKDANTLAVCTTAFAGFASMAFLGLKFQMEIWLAHAPERHRAAQQERQHRQQALNEVRGRRAAVEQLAREQQAQSRASNTASVEQARIDGRLPIPVTSPAIFNPSDQDTTQPIETPATAVTGNDAQPTPARDGATMYYGFYFTLSCLFISTAWALLWPKPLAYGYGYMITFAYLSFWTPQIFRNAMRNCRKALTWEYVVGESLSRVFIPVYLCTVSGNVYYIEPNITVAVGFAAWVWIQAWILVGQDLIGPRFFVPKGWTPPAYNYHPILRDDSAEGSGADIEAGDTLPLGYLRADKREISPTTRPSSSSSEILSTSGEAHKQDGHKHLFDCAICMQTTIHGYAVQTHFSHNVLGELDGI
ncbi:hypothetical protein KEM54_001629 [Ascosphaera aggregata]|nr:hypothetical protein KEM54_001629 [Ascosphaera aggregata]